jgi:hypothetical protein
MIVRRNLTDRKVKSLRRDLNLEDKLGHYDTWDALTPRSRYPYVEDGTPDLRSDGPLSRQSQPHAPGTRRLWAS